ncbi:MAG: SM-like, degradation of cytoplasmic mRNAs and positively regulates transcription initiation [Alyxoria varia]|nr:MAG: SM-like, degradation of cytoplasmic mRNAs and positively regulates transcription initiation [Alyxoria varia]
MENLTIRDTPPLSQGGSSAPPQDQPQAQQAPAGQPPPLPQLPPQMFTTAASLLDLTDSESPALMDDACSLLSKALWNDVILKAATTLVPEVPTAGYLRFSRIRSLRTEKLMVELRDGRKLIGVLRSWDQFVPLRKGNLVLQDAVERIYAGHMFADVPQGIYIVRGENVMLIGEIDLDKEDDIPAPYVQGTPTEVHAAKKIEDEKLKARNKKRLKMLKAMGFEGESMGEAIL